MTPYDLLAAFETLAEAPDGIARLRELVLQLAVRGKLVPQDPNDEPACVLLERIAAEKEWLVKEGKIPKAKPLPPVSEDEVPFVVPEEWVWCRLSDVFLRITDGTHHSPPNGPEGDFKYITAKNIKPEGISLEAVTFVSRYMHETIYSRCNPEKGDILYIKDGATTGVVTVNSLDEPFSMLSSVCLLKTSQKVEPWYACFALRSDFFLSQMRDQMSGTGIPRVTLTKLNEAVLPIPPLPEQHRIVAKVDALMALLDRLEAARSERETTRAALRNAALAALRDAHDAEAVEAAWTRIAERMDDLFTDPADVAPLRQTILQLAVRGKLVPQDPNDEPACVLLGERIVAPADDEPWSLPCGWEWSSMRCLGDILGGGTPSKSNSGYWGGDIPWVSPKDMKCDQIADTIDHITETAIEGSSVRLIPAGSLLMVVRGMILMHSFPTALTQVSVTINQDMKALIPFRSDIADYLLLVSKGLRDVVLMLVERSTHGTCKLPSDSILNLLLPIPPLSEQHRIVAKVDALMTLCNALEARLAAAREAQAAFAAAAVHHLDT